MTNTAEKQFDKFYVIDTNIILQDAHSLITLSDDSQNLIVIPETVLDEIDSKKSGHGEINYQARVFGRLLADAEVVSMNSVSGDYKIIELKINHGFNVRVDIISKEMYKAESSRTIAANIMNDRKIIEIAKFAQDHYLKDDTTAKLVFLSFDIMARTRALSLKIPTDTMRGSSGQQFDYEFHKTVELEADIEPEDICGRDIIELDLDHKCYNFSYSFRCPNGREILTAVYDGKMECLDEDEIRRQAVSPKNKEQLFFSNAIMDHRYQVVVSDARAGSGKTLLATSGAMKMVRRKAYSKIVYIRNSIESLDKGEEVGFLSQPLYSKILTPSGWKILESLNIGDIVSTPNNKTAKIKTLSPITNKMTYRIEMKDGSVTYASGEHLWDIEYAKKRRLMTTLEIKRTIELGNYKAKNMFLPNVQLQTFNEEGNNKLPLHPYFIGYMVGDGMLSCGHTRVSIGEQDLKESTRNLSHCLSDFPEYSIKQSSGSNTFTISKSIKGTKRGNKIRTLLGELNLLCTATNKRLPEQYLLSTVEERQELLKGLIDSDGYIRTVKIGSHASEVGFNTINHKLAEDVKFLVNSLGGRASIKRTTHEKESIIKGIKCNNVGEIYNVYISNLSFIPAKLNRKANNFKPTRFPSRNRIVSISEHKVEPVKCLGLDDDEHLYITDDYIVTHNSGNDEKFKIYNHPLMDCLEFIVKSEMNKTINNKAGAKESDINETSTQEKVEETITRYGIEPMWVGEMRGRTVSDAVVIIDEAQNMSNKTMQLILTRLDATCKVIVLGSNLQIDSFYVNKHTNGLSTLLKATQAEYKEVKMFSIQLTRVLRGPITEWAEKIFTGEFSK